MKLNGKGKDGSRELAVQLFPQSADLLKCANLDFCVALGSLLTTQLAVQLCLHFIVHANRGQLPKGASRRCTRGYGFM